MTTTTSTMSTSTLPKTSQEPLSRRKRSRIRRMDVPNAVKKMMLTAVVAARIACLFDDQPMSRESSPSATAVVVVSALSCIRHRHQHHLLLGHTSLQHQQTFLSHHQRHLPFTARTRLRRRRMSNELLAASSEEEEEEKGDDDGSKITATSASKSKLGPRMDPPSRLQQQESQNARRHEDDVLGIINVVDVVAILLACELMQLLNVVNSSQFILNGGWFQPLPLIPSTFTQFIVHFSTTCCCWLLSSSTTAAPTSSSSSWTRGAWIRTISMFAVLETIAATAISTILITDGEIGGGGGGIRTHGIVINSDDMVMSIDTVHLQSILSTVGRDLYIVLLFIWTLRFLHRQIYY